MTSTLTEPINGTTPPPGTAMPVTPDSTPKVATTAPVVPAATPPNADTPETAIAAPTATNPTIPTPQDLLAPPTALARGDRDELLRLLRLLVEQEREHVSELPPATPQIGEHNLMVEGLIKVRSDDGVLVSIPVNTVLPGALSPAAIQSAHIQFETILTQLVTQPAMMAFAGHLDRIQAQRKGEEPPAENHRDTAQIKIYGLPPAFGKRI